MFKGISIGDKGQQENDYNQSVASGSLWRQVVEVLEENVLAQEATGIIRHEWCSYLGAITGVLCSIYKCALHAFAYATFHNKNSIKMWSTALCV